MTLQSSLESPVRRPPPRGRTRPPPPPPPRRRGPSFPWIQLISGIAALATVGCGSTLVWASRARDLAIDRIFEVPPMEFRLALYGVERHKAVARGRHLVESRYGCTECHGQDLGGAKVVDDPSIGRIYGPNLTTGEGSATRRYTAVDWDRIVRHGVLPDGTAAMMPSTAYATMTDEELTDVVAYIRAMPPVDRTVPPRTFGPVLTWQIATGEVEPSAVHIDHDAAHAPHPPENLPTPELGAHIARACTGCHGDDLGGGRGAGADPTWPDAPNLTPHASGLGGWTYADFEHAVRDGVGRDRRRLGHAMPSRLYAGMTDTEVEALWAYVQAVPPVDTTPE